MAKNSLILLVFLFLHQLLVLIQLKILTNWLGKNQLGQYFTLLAIAAIISIFIQLGLPFVASRFIAKYKALSQNLTAKKLVFFSWIVILFSGAALLLLNFLFSKKVLGTIYAIPPSSYLLTWAIVLNIVISFKAITYSSFYGLQKMEFPAITETLIALGIGLLLFLFRFELSVLKVLQINFLVNLIFSVFLSLFLILTLKGNSEKTPKINLLGDIKSFWLGAVATSFLSIALSYTDQILISMLLSYSSVAIFFLASKTISLSRQIIAIPLDAFSPEITRKWELNLKQNLEENLRFFTKTIFILAVFLATLTFSLAGPIIYIISSREFGESIAVLMILSLALPLITIFSPINYFFRAIGKIGYSLLVDFIWLFGYLICGFLLLRWKGLFGLAIAFVLVSLFLAIFNLGRVRKFILWKIEKPVSVLLCGLTVTLIVSILTRVLPIASIPKLLIGITLVFALYNAFLVRWNILTTEDKQWLLNLTSNQYLKKAIAFGLAWPMGKNKI